MSKSKNNDSGKVPEEVQREKEAVKALEACQNEAEEMAQKSPGDPNKRLLAGAGVADVYAFLVEALRRAAAVARLPFVRENIPQLRVFVEAMSPGFFKWALLAVLQMIESVPGDSQEDISVELVRRLSASR